MPTKYFILGNKQTFNKFKIHKFYSHIARPQLTKNRNNNIIPKLLELGRKARRS